MKDIFKIRKFANISLIIGIVCLFAASGFMANEMAAAGWILLGLGLLLAGAFFVLGALYWRCPHCGHGFELRQGAMDKIKVCPYCGQRLRY